MGFKDTLEYKQMIKMRPACNRVLKHVFGVDDKSIIRYEKECESNSHLLDRHFAIDLKIILPNETQLTGQEKALSNKFYQYKTFTIEFYQNRYDKEPGEFFKIASQFYLSGYSDSSGIQFVEWKIIKVFDFMIWLKQKSIDDLEKQCKFSGGSNASFLPIKYKDIPKECIYADGDSITGIININGKINQL